VSARRGQQHAAVGRQPEQPRAEVALLGERVREALAAARADLDLGADQLPGHGLTQRVIGLRGLSQLLEALHQPPALRVEDPELLLEADREVSGALEGLPGASHVQHGIGS